MQNLKDIDVDQYLLDSVKIQYASLEAEFVKLPADLAYWGERYARAWKSYNLAKIDTERVEARLHIELREKLMSLAKEAAASDPKAKIKSPTVDDIKSVVSSHEDLAKAKEAELDAEAEKVRLWGVLDAIRAKRDMLIQLGAQARAEMQGNPVIRDEQGTRPGF